MMEGVTSSRRGLTDFPLVVLVKVCCAISSAVTDWLRMNYINIMHLQLCSFRNEAGGVRTFT